MFISDTTSIKPTGEPAPFAGVPNRLETLDACCPSNKVSISLFVSEKVKSISFPAIFNVPITGWLDVAIFDKDDETKLVAWIENKTSYPKPKGHYKKNTGDNKVGDRRWESPSFPLTPSVYYEPQMSIYYKATNILGHQIHCTPNGTQLFRPEEHETLQKEHLEGVLKGIYQKLMVRQNLLKLCNDAETFMRLSEPDFKYWKIQDWNPEYKQLLRGVYDY